MGFPRVGEGIGGRLGFFRGYLATIAAHNRSDLYLSDLSRYVLANPRLRRLFCSEPNKDKKSKFIFEQVVGFLFTFGC